MRKQWADIILVICAIAMVGLALKNQFRSSNPRAMRAEGTVVSTWREFQVPERRVGDDAAKVSIVVFSDYQCSYCRALWSVLDTLAREDVPNVAITLRHLPIAALHPQARQASAFAECARSDGRFRQADSLLFRWVDSVKLERWSALARRAGMTDPSTVETCMGSVEIAALIGRDSIAAEKLEATGTPLMLINDRKVSGFVDLSTLRGLVRAAAR